MKDLEEILQSLGGLFGPAVFGALAGIEFRAEWLWSGFGGFSYGNSDPAAVNKWAYQGDSGVIKLNIEYMNEKADPEGYFRHYATHELTHMLVEKGGLGDPMGVVDSFAGAAGWTYTTNADGTRTYQLPNPNDGPTWEARGGDGLIVDPAEDLADSVTVFLDPGTPVQHLPLTQDRQGWILSTGVASWRTWVSSLAPLRR